MYFPAIRTSSNSGWNARPAHIPAAATGATWSASGRMLGFGSLRAAMVQRSAARGRRPDNRDSSARFGPGKSSDGLTRMKIIGDLDQVS